MKKPMRRCDRPALESEAFTLWVGLLMTLVNYCLLGRMYSQCRLPDPAPAERREAPTVKVPRGFLTILLFVTSKTPKIQPGNGCQKSLSSRLVVSLSAPHSHIVNSNISNDDYFGTVLAFPPTIITYYYIPS